MKDILYEDKYTFFILSRSVLLRMRKIREKSCRETRNKHFMFNDLFFENRTVYNIMWNNIEQRGMPQMTIWRMHIACWIPKATNTNKSLC